MYSPWADIAERYPDIHVERCDISPCRGAWVPSERVIFIDRALERPDRRATLAHELCHVDLDHRPVGGWFGRRMEHDADTLAARRLLHDVRRIADAIALHPLEPGLVARELDVPLRILRRRLESLTVAEKVMIDDRLSGVERGC